MKTITIRSINDLSRSIAIEDINAEGNPSTYQDICKVEDVKMFFDAEEQDLLDNLICINDNSIPRDFFNVIVGSVVNDGDVIDFDLDAVDDEDYDEEADAEDEAADSTEDTSNEPVEGEEGTVKVYVSIIDVDIKVVNGRTKVSDCIMNETVRGRTGMTDAMLSNQEVTLNDQPLQPAELSARTVKDGDVLRLSPRGAKDRGAMNM